MYTIKFLPGDIKDFITDAMQMVGVSGSQYMYDPTGSTVKFTPTQLKAFLLYLRDAKKYANETGEFTEIVSDIDRVVEHIRQFVMNDASIAQASTKYNISKIANTFNILLKVSEDPLKDPLLKKDRIEPEMTEELDEVVKDSLHLVILLQRVFMDFAKECSASAGEKRELGSKLAEQVLFELKEIEENLQTPVLLDFDLDTESGVLDDIRNSIRMIQMALEFTKPLHGGSRAPEAFRSLDLNVHKWVHELQENCEKLEDSSTAQSPYMEHYFADKPVRMVERDERDIDQIDPDEIHVDY